MSICPATPRLPAVDRRRQLLEVAADLFARRGFRGTTTAELAKSAGVTEPILYRHFPSKLDLFISLIDEASDQIIQAHKERSADVHTPAKRLQLFVDRVSGMAARNAGSCHIMLQAMTDASLEPKIANLVRQHFGKLQSLLAKQLIDLQKTGVVRQDESAPTLASAIISIAIGADLVAPFVSNDKRQSNTDLRSLNAIMKTIMITPAIPASGIQTLGQ